MKVQKCGHKPSVHFYTSFRFKIFLLFFLFALVICTTLGILLYDTSTDVLKQQMFETMDNNLQNTSFNLDSLLQSVRRIATEVSMNPVVTDTLLEQPALDSYAYLKLAQEMRRLLNQARNDSSFIKSLYVVSSDLNYFYKSQIDRTFMREELQSADWAQLLRSSKDNVWYVLSGDNPAEWSPEHTLTAVFPVYNLRVSRRVGYVVANVSYQSIRNYLKKIRFGESGYMVVYNTQDRLVFHPDTALNGKSEIDILPEIDPAKPNNSIQRRDTLVTYSISSDSGLAYAAYIPMAEVIRPVIPIRNMTILLIAICSAGALLYALLIARQIFAPIEILVSYMEQAGQGKTGIRIAETRQDEMGLLYNSFNRMMEQIQQLIRRLYEQELLTKELQLANLQIQLNPHFLYNTLDSIHWAARENNREDVCKMTFLLSRYFRQSLSDGRDFISIGEAAAIAESYIELQRIRYLDKIQYDISVDPELREEKVLKYLFQPLVENAILHGIERKSGKGVCLISWKRLNGQIQFRVEDNGIGIPQKQLEELRRNIADNSGEGHFALRNINRQLQLYYGWQATLSIQSVAGRGTRVEFLVPLGGGASNVPTDSGG